MSEPRPSRYPLLRRRRRARGGRRVWRPGPRLRLGIVLVAALVVLGGVVSLALRPSPPSADHLFARSLAALERGNIHAAYADAQAAARAAPQAGIVQAVLARTLIDLGEGAAAEAALDRAVAVGLPNGRLHQLRAAASLLQGDPDAALAHVAQAEPAYADYALRVRARALAAKGQGAAAQAELGDLLSRSPGDGAAWADLGRIRLSAGEVGGAAAAAAQAVRMARRDPAALTLQGEVVRSRYGLVGALPWFEAALRSDAYYHPALIEYAGTLGDAGRATDAVAATRRALVSRPGSQQAYYLQAVIAARAGNRVLARRLLQLTGGVIGNTPGVMLLDGALAFADRQDEQAAGIWRRLVAAQPMNVTARRLLANALLRSGDAAGALDVIRPIVLRGDADGYALRLAAHASAALGQHAQAAQLLDRAASGQRGPSTIFQSADALGALQAEASRAAGDPTYALGVIRGLASGGNLSQAVAQARALVAAAPGAPAAQLAYGDTLAASGRYAEAVAAYGRAADLSFDEPALLRLLDAYGRLNRPRDAAATLALYLSQNPQSTVGARILGGWQLGGGEVGAAIETLEGVRAAAGDREAGLLADLARAYALIGEGAVARIYGRAAYALAPMSAAVTDAYGVALIAAGDRNGARQLLDKAVALAPGDAAIRAHRAEIGGAAAAR